MVNYRSGNKVILSIVKSENYKDKKGGYEDYIGKADSKMLVVELEFDSGTYSYPIHSDTLYHLGQKTVSMSYDYYDPPSFTYHNSLVFDFNTLKVKSLKPKSIKQGLDTARKCVESGELSLAFNSLFDLYFLPTYGGTALHSSFEFKNFMQYIGPTESKQREIATKYVQNLDIRMIDNNRRIIKYKDRMFEPNVDHRVWLQKMVI